MYLSNSIAINTQIARLSVFTLLSLLVIGSVEAQVIVDNIIDKSLTNYQIQFDYFGVRAGNLLVNTFYSLAVIELSWALIQVFIRNGGLQDFLSTLVTRILFIGFFAFLLSRGSATANEIFASFTDLAIATTITDGVVSPSNIMDVGQDLWARMYSQATSIGVFDIIFDEEAKLSTPDLFCS